VAARPVRLPGVQGPGEIALILAAERLFAEQGIDAVPLRHINQAAKQKNMSAAHYHFGSRDGLVRAVLMHRLPGLDRRRGALLSRAADTRDIRFYLNAFIRPLVQELMPKDEGNFYLRFMQQYERYRGDYDLVRQLTPESVAIYGQLERLIGYLPEPVRRLRIGYLINMIHAVLATAEERLGTGKVPPGDIELIAANLVDMVANALAAPLSADTLALMEQEDGELDRGGTAGVAA
jgi:AcrR family transcriptional regulator